jgi:hypothetical protein
MDKIFKDYEVNKLKEMDSITFEEELKRLVSGLEKGYNKEFFLMPTFEETKVSEFTTAITSIFTILGFRATFGRQKELEHLVKNPRITIKDSAKLAIYIDNGEYKEIIEDFLKYKPLDTSKWNSSKKNKKQYGTVEFDEVSGFTILYLNTCYPLYVNIGIVMRTLMETMLNNYIRNYALEDEIGVKEIKQKRPVFLPEPTLNDIIKLKNLSLAVRKEIILRHKEMTKTETDKTETEK